jgi:Skp family chaperone for outer membrane proteins
MKRTLIRVAAAVAMTVLLGASVVATATSAAAQQAQVPIVIAVLDVNLLLRDSSAAKAVRDQIEKQRNAYQADLVQQENKLREIDKQLAQQRASLSEQEFNKRRDDLNKQIDALRAESDKRKQQLEKAFNTGMQQVTKVLEGVLAEIAKARGLTLVINKAMVPLSANDLDITQEALKMLNAKLPTVNVPQGQ